MKWDTNLIAKLLLSLEGSEEVDFGMFDNSTLLIHKARLIEAGFAKGSVLRGDDEIKAVKLSELTLDGHRELSNLRASGQLTNTRATNVEQPSFQTQPAKLTALTPQQQDLLQWMVSKIKGNELSPEFLVGWVSNGPIIANHSSLDVPNSLTKGNLLILSDTGFVRTWPSDRYSPCTLRFHS